MNRLEKVAAKRATQVKYPWRATFRTVFAAIVAIAPLLPAIAGTAGVATIPGVAAVLALVATVTRVLAVPGVEAWLRKYFPFLAAQPKVTDELTNGGVHSGIETR